MTLDLPGGRDHPSWLTAISTFVAYGVVIAIVAVLLFGLPYLAFSAL